MKEMKEVTLRLPSELHEQLRKEAERLGVTAQSLIVFILWGGRFS